MLEKIEMLSEKEMISELEQSGIKILYTPKALVPVHYGTLYWRDDKISLEEMDIYDAWKKICRNPMRNHDPFSK